VVGSALVNQIASHADQPELARKGIATIIADMRSAMDR